MGILSDNQCSDAAWTVKLVRSQRKRRDPKLLEIHGYLADRLDRVRMDRYASFEAQGCNFRNGLQYPSFVVSEHNADQFGGPTQQLA